MQRAESLYNCQTTAGSERTDGVVLALISWWILRGGLADIEAVADSCSWESLQVKRDDALGEAVLAVRDYGRELLQAAHADASMAHLLRMLELGPETPLPADLRGNFQQGSPRILRWRLEGMIGQRLQDCGWWKRNERRIKKERDKFKSVLKVMES